MKFTIFALLITFFFINHIEESISSDKGSRTPRFSRSETFPNPESPRGSSRKYKVSSASKAGAISRDIDTSIPESRTPRNRPLRINDTPGQFNWSLTALKNKSPPPKFTPSDSFKDSGDFFRQSDKKDNPEAAPLKKRIDFEEEERKLIDDENQERQVEKKKSKKQTIKEAKELLEKLRMYDEGSSGKRG